MIQHIYAVYLKKKMDSEIEKSLGIEEAFKLIRNATGLTDVQGIVMKFLTREQTYSKLLMVVSDYEKEIDTLKTYHDKGRDVLHALASQRENEQSWANFPEVQKLNEEIQRL